jgi:hypothetical protein
MWIAALVVFMALAALVGSLALLLHYYPGTTSSTGATTNAANSGTVVSILTPLATAIAATIGLYFGISASGSSRGQATQAQAQTAAFNHSALKAAAALTPEQAHGAGLL